VRFVVSAGLPPARADSGLLDRVLANVLENALRHSPGRQEVVVHASAVADRIQLRVVDRGVGVPEEAKELIFAPFQRFGDTPKAGTGVGLGLAVARGLMEAMGGTIAAEDTPGGGLTIVIELDQARVGPAAPPAPAAPSVARAVATADQATADEATVWAERMRP
jgi:two-component system sensor histidine kinase KdpD